ncbi:tyrosine-type recombinase/integrase [Mycobacterium sp. CBMA271]|uniref:tyrosine-type recombinase/integrase n=1 Tax=unclassified Mycobacteroides TaxID=2618759 RepID=UPI0012DC1052|nr:MULTISPECIES: site-specific integrase [unclassified Mycobacteroides]MUM21918.1 tyrosine-type recombinase/integrase [Mycobacteroides sp. CBMA 271]
MSCRAAVRVAGGKLKQSTLDEYERLLRCYLLDAFGPRAVASITSTDCEEFRARLVTQASRQGDKKPLTPGSRKHAWDMLCRVLAYTMKQHGAIPANPADATYSPSARGRGDHEKFEHRPLTAGQVGQLSAAIAGEVADLPAYPVYALMVQFLPYSGLHAAENSGLEIGDLVFSPGPKCSVNVRRTKERDDGQWVARTLKSKKSRRTVPLQDWLAERLAAYLAEHRIATTRLRRCGRHGRTEEAIAQPGRAVRGAAGLVPAARDGRVLRHHFPPSLGSDRLAGHRPATADEPAVRGVRLHDLRHTFAAMQLSAGVHFMLVSKWLGHSTFTLTLDTYGDYILEEDGGALNTLPEPPVPAHVAEGTSNVVPLLGRQFN